MSTKPLRIAGAAAVLVDCQPASAASTPSLQSRIGLHPDSDIATVRLRVATTSCEGCPPAAIRHLGYEATPEFRQ